MAPVCRRYCDELRLSPPDGQLWVNSRASQLAMRSKALQLQIATGLGFQIPETLVTNDPAAARRFVGRPGEFIVKSISPMRWEEEGKVIALHTSKITVDELEDEDAVRACPMVYQRLIEKRYELRVIVFGDDILWVKIHSQDSGRYGLDWRKGIAEELRLEEVPPPDGAAEKIRAYCRAAGLVHGSFDLAVTPEGGIVFFEVNEQGQTLWIEEVNEDIAVFDTLNRFLWRESSGEPAPWRDQRLLLRDYLDLSLGSGPPAESAAASGSRLV